MGRPVFHTYDLPAIVAGSHLTLLGAWAQPRTRTDDETGAVYFRITVHEVLDENVFLHRPTMQTSDFTAPALPAHKPGTVVEVLSNPTTVKLHAFRRSRPDAPPPSFPADRYRTDEAILDEDPLVLFTIVREGGLRLSADLSVESPSRRAEIEAALAADRPLRAAREERAAAWRARMEASTPSS